MHIKSLLLLTALCFLFACTSKDNTNSTTTVKDSNTNDQEKKKEEDINNTSKNLGLEESISIIKEKFQDTEKNLKSYTQNNAEMQVQGGAVTQLTIYTDKDGQPRKIISEEAMGHGAYTTSYYMKDGTTYFIFEQSSSEASVTGPFTFSEKRIYFKDNNIIRILEKETTVKGNQDANLAKIPNKDITATVKDKSGKNYIGKIDKILRLFGAGS